MTYNQETVENLIVYKALTQQSFMTLIYEHLDSDLFDKSYNKTVIGLFHKFVKENKKYPKPDELTLIINDDNTKNSFREAIKTYKALDKNISDEVFLPYVEKFLKDKLKFKAIAESVHDYENGQLDNAEVIKRFDKAQNIALISDFGLDYFRDLSKRLEEIQKTDARIPTGFHSLDKKLNGGILKAGKCLICVMAAPNVGKSLWLGALCSSFLQQGLRVSIISLEMSELVYASRIDSLLSDMDINTLKDNTDELGKRINSYYDKTGAELIIKEFPPKSVTPKTLQGYYQRLIDQNKKPDVVIIDYLNLLKCSEDGLSRDQQITLISEELRGLSYLGFPVITATQANRGALTDNKSSPDMSNTSDSLGIPRTADFMISLWQEEEDKMLGVIRSSIIKNRFGPAFGNSNYRLNFSTLRLTEEGDYFSESALDAENKLNQL